MLVTVFGIVIEVRLKEFANASSPMLVTVYSVFPSLIVDGITTLT